METIRNNRDLGAAFSQMFELVPALDATTLDQVHWIRHEVYCRDLGWEPPRPDERERDEFDRHAFHCLLRRRGTGEAVGCTRLIVARPEDPEYLLPFERSCADVLDRGSLDPARLPRRSIGEVSRLAVLGSYRQRKGEGEQPVALSSADFGGSGAMQRFPFIPVSLYLGAAAIARRFGIEHVFVLTEPRLASHFARIGFDIQTVGGPIEHRGTRIPSLLSSSKVVADLRPLIRPLYDVIEHNIDVALAARPMPCWLSALSAGPGNSQSSARFDTTTGSIPPQSPSRIAHRSERHDAALPSGVSTIGGSNVAHGLGSA